MKRYLPFLLAVLLCPWTFHLASANPIPNLSADLVELQVKGIAIDPNRQVPIVILAAPASQQAFPMWIGQPEARAIAMEMESVPAPRPLTHMLLKNILVSLDVDVQRIVIHSVRQNTFHAAIFLQQGETQYTIDARPSDAIALALSTKAAIFAAPMVLESVNTIALPSKSASPTLVKKFGMHMQSLDDQLAQAFHLSSTDGVLIAYVEANSHAARHGVQRGDVIVQVDGQPIQTLDDIMVRFTPEKPGQHVLLVTRDQEPVTILLDLPSAD